MMLPAVLMLPIFFPGTCFTSAPPRSVFEFGFARWWAAIDTHKAQPATIALDTIIVAIRDMFIDGLRAGILLVRSCHSSTCCTRQSLAGSFAATASSHRVMTTMD